MGAVVSTMNIFNPLLSQLQSKAGLSETQAQSFVESVAADINESTLLQSQIADLDSKGWTIQLSRQGGQTTGNQIDISYTNVTSFVGTLSHEAGHAEDPQNNTIYYSGNALSIGAETALNFLSEGKAQLNNVSVSQQAAISSNGGLVIPIAGSQQAVNSQKNDLTSNNNLQAIIDGADSYVNLSTSGDGQSYPAYYWDINYNSQISLVSSVTPPFIVTDLGIININDTESIIIGQKPNGIDQIIFTFGLLDTVQSYIDDFGNYGSIVPSTTSGGQNKTIPKSPSPDGVATYQQFDFSNGLFDLEIINPQFYQGIITGFDDGSKIDLAGVGTASSAVLSSNNTLQITGTSAGSIFLMLDPSEDFTGYTFNVGSDGNDGTVITLGQAPTHTITFSEQPLGTVNPVYNYPDTTADVLGEIVNDSSQPTSPVVAANTSYTGPVFIDFTTPVTHVEFDVGYFDELQSTTVTFIGPGGDVLQTSQNSQLGFQHFSFDSAEGISAVNVVNTGFDGNGFGVDNVTFSGSMTPAAAKTIVDITPTGASSDPIFTFTVTRSGDISAASSVGYAVTGSGSNPLLASDLPNDTFPVGQVDFAAGQASQTLDINVLSAFTLQNPKTFAVTLIAPSTGTVVGAASSAAETTLPPPTISNTVAGQQTTDTSTVNPFASVTISDQNVNQTETVTVTQSAAIDGTLTNLGDGSYNLTSGVYTDVGSPADVTAALDGLVFTPTLGEAAGGQTVTTGFTITDIDAAGAIATDTSTTVLAAPTNITVTGPTDTTFLTATKPINSDTLAIIGNVALSGDLNTGVLSVGAAGIPGTLDLAAATSLDTSAANVINGSINLSGSDTDLNVSGTLSINPSQSNTLPVSFNTVNVSNGAAVQVGNFAFVPATMSATYGGFSSVTVDGSSSFEIGSLDSAAAGTFTVDAGSTFTGSGSIIAPAIIINGTVSDQGLIQLDGSESGVGPIQIGATGYLVLDENSVSTGSVAFSESGGTLAISYSSRSGQLDDQGTINGFGSGDTISYNGDYLGVSTPLTAATYTAGSNGQGTLTLSDGSTALGNLALAGNYAGDSFQVTPGVSPDSYNISLVKPAVSDFDGDGKSDILFQNTTGSIDAWLMNGLSIASSGVIANPGTTWHPIGTGDFDGDGKADILYQNDNGVAAIWTMNGLSIASNGTVANPGPSWHAIGTGDFDGDGKSDILFQNDSGAVDIWTMNGLSITNSGTVANPGPSWHAVGVGDFDGDGKSDILFQNDDGTVDIWTMNGLSIASSGAVTNPGPSWHAVGVGDFDGDGKSDILFQNNNGEIDIWTMNGLSIASSGAVANPGSSWHAVGVGDYNGDGKADILFQNDNGNIDIWGMNGLTLASSGSVANPSTAWQAVGLGGMHFIDGTQTIGSTAGTIQPDNFVFTTSLPGSHAITGFNPLDDVITLDQNRFGSFSSVQQNETTSGGNTIINLGSGSTLTLSGILPSALSPKNFV